MRAVLTALCLAALSGLASAQPGPWLQRGIGVVGGVYGSIAVHEAGHAAVALAQGATDLSIRIPGEQCRLLCGATRYRMDRPLSAAEARVLSVAGFAASAAATEALLASRPAARSAVGQGMIATHLASNVLHVHTYYTRRVGVDGYTGNDIDQFEQAGGNPHLLAAALVLHSIATLHRMRQREIPLLYMQLRF